jgi:dGTPase
LIPDPPKHSINLPEPPDVGSRGSVVLTELNIGGSMAILGKVPVETGYAQYDAERQFEEAHPEKQQNRATFEIDKGRIVHSSAFRRLQGKTEVLGVGERDFYRTRLTHSLEVAQIARGICTEVENPADFTINTDLVETIALAHDIGHPPFGHVGEDHLHSLMLQEGGFGANPQNLRIVSFVETKLAGGGLNLTRATLDGLTKYPRLFSRSDFIDEHGHPILEGTKPKKPKFVYDHHAGLLAWIKEGVKNSAAKPIEGEIADWADTAAYSVNDIEDNLRAGIMDFLEMRKRADQISALTGGVITPTDVVETAEELYKKLIVEPQTFRDRKMRLKAWTSETIFRLISGCKFVVRDKNEQSNRYKYGFEIPNENKNLSKLLGSAVTVLCFKDPRVLTLEHKGKYVMTELFNAFVSDHTLLPRDFQELIEQDPAMRKRLIADFISGMTDTYAMNYYARLFEPGEGSFYEDV